VLELRIIEIEKLLMIYMEGQIQKCVPPGFMMIQTKTINLLEDLKGKFPEGEQTIATNSSMQ
jgi:hypothetical protein